MRAVAEALQRQEELRGGPMRAPDEVAAMVRLKALGWGVRRIAVELGCSHMTVRRYLEAGGALPNQDRAACASPAGPRAVARR